MLFLLLIASGKRIGFHPRSGVEAEECIEIAALLLKLNDEWQLQQRYLQHEELMLIAGKKLYRILAVNS